MALITAMIGKDTLTYGEMKRQPDKPEFITSMQKEISDDKKRKHWRLIHRSKTEWEKTNMVIWSLSQRRYNIIGKVKNTNPELVCTVEYRRKA